MQGLLHLGSEGEQDVTARTRSAAAAPAGVRRPFARLIDTYLHHFHNITEYLALKYLPEIPPKKLPGPTPSLLPAPLRKGASRRFPSLCGGVSSEFARGC